jgi:5-oxoprolinase (ATP-hydrolysing)
MTVRRLKREMIIIKNNSNNATIKSSVLCIYSISIPSLLPPSTSPPSLSRSPKVNIRFMKSDGGLTPVKTLGGHNAILSGPAGGVVGYAKTSYRLTPEQREQGLVKPQPVVGFDMGGTSTDVSRYDGTFPQVFESTVAGIIIQSPQLDINTVAAGGGSRLYLRGGRLVVGPESVGSHPGPACYRKGGDLAVTDANVVLRRVIPSRFPKIFGPNEDSELDREGAVAKFNELWETDREAFKSVEELAYGFLTIANEAMCRPIRNLTQMKGYDLKTHTLSCFGGAGPQHACAVAKKLGIRRVIVHRYSGVLSAYGLSLSDAVSDHQGPAADKCRYDASKGIDGQEEESMNSRTARQQRFKVLQDQGVADLVQEGYEMEDIKIYRYANLRYEGTDNVVMIESKYGSDSSDFFADFGRSFKDHYRRQFGFDLERDIFIDDYRVRCVVEGSSIPALVSVPSIGRPQSNGQHDAYFDDGWQVVDLFESDKLKPGHVIVGPAIIIQPISTVIIECGCVANITCESDIEITVDVDNVNIDDNVTPSTAPSTTKDEEIKEDPIQLSIMGHRFMNIAECMGQTLANTSVSTNIRERLDFSCALFGADGGLVAK